MELEETAILQGHKRMLCLLFDRLNSEPGDAVEGETGENEPRRAYGGKVKIERSLETGAMTQNN